jgi:glycerol-3-phosphate dehydrogenase
MNIRRGFEYSDCWVDDARLVVLNAVDAAERGAEVLTRTACHLCPRENGGWTIETKNSVTGETRSFRARCIANTAGPWVNRCHRPRGRRQQQPQCPAGQGQPHHRAEILGRANAYLVQNHDKRVIFINPYEGDKALIGTTDISYEGRAEDVKADEKEIDYLLAAVNRYFKEKLRRQDVLHSFSGVRPLFDDGKGNPSAVTRDYVFDLEETGNAPLLNVFGGKITTFRELAERGLQRLKHIFPQMGPDWTEHAALPGGEMPNADYESFSIA